MANSSVAEDILWLIRIEKGINPVNPENVDIYFQSVSHLTLIILEPT